MKVLQSDAPREIISRNPATGEELGRVPLTGADEVALAVARARTAQPLWASHSLKQRTKVIREARRIVLEELEEVAALISSETGKPVAEAISMEIVPTLDLMNYFARRAGSLLKSQKIDIGQYGLMGRSSRIVYEPLGVVGIISPWNFPWATPLDEVVMALVAGNAVVLKPSELTSLTALKIGDVFRKAGLPNGALEIVTGDGATGASLVESGVNKIMFTGSVATGKRVAEAAAKYLVPVVLELGGKDPMIVFEDAHLNNAARGAVWGAFANAGQACAAVERCYVQESIATAFVARVIDETTNLKQGSPEEGEVDIAGMTSEKQLQTVERHVEDAILKGAALRTGGHRVESQTGWYYEPTVLTSVDHRMMIMREETFGPVLPIMTFRTEDEAVKLANDSSYGLTASVWTRDIARGKRVAQQIEAGTVMVNEAVYTHGIASTPWGGVKQSGYGRTHGRLGLLELVAPKHIHVNRAFFLPDLWWFRYNANAGRLFRGLARHFTTGSVLRTSVLLPQIIRRLLQSRRDSNPNS